MECDFKNIIYEKRGNHTAIITINREGFRNAIDDDTTLEICNALDIIEKESGVRLVVITGKGNKAFCAGADLNKIMKKTSKDIFRYNLQDLSHKIENYPLPVMALINGAAMGGGLEIALACDFRIAVKGIKLGLPETSIGLIPSAGGTQRLIKLIGESVAKEMIMLGRIIKSEEAVKIGLVNKVIDADSIDEEIESIVSEISLRSKNALTFAKWAMNLSEKENIYSGMKYEKMCQAVLLDGEDKQEGINAFFQKRSPNYK